MKTEPKDCPFQPFVRCGEHHGNRRTSQDCAVCGWNPEVAERRKEALRRKYGACSDKTKEG